MPQCMGVYMQSAQLQCTTSRGEIARDELMALYDKGEITTQPTIFGAFGPAVCRKAAGVVRKLRFGFSSRPRQVST